MTAEVRTKKLRNWIVAALLESGMQSILEVCGVCGHQKVSNVQEGHNNGGRSRARLLLVLQFEAAVTAYRWIPDTTRKHASIATGCSSKISRRVCSLWECLLEVTAAIYDERDTEHNNHVH